MTTPRTPEQAVRLVGFAWAPADAEAFGLGAVVVAVPYGSPRLRRLEDEGFRLTPSGQKHTLIRTAAP